MATLPVVDLAGTPFLDRMPRASRAHVLVNSSRIRYAAGAIAFQAGDPDRADILEKGFARLYLTSAEGRQTTIRYVHPGELMGGLLVMGGVFDGSVQMIVDPTVIHLDLLTVRRRVEVDPASGNALAADLAQRYTHCVRTIALHAFGSLVQKVAFDLLDRACRTQLSGGHLEAAVSQQEIADGIGSVRPVVAKALTTIRGRRLVDTAHRRVRIIAPGWPDDPETVAEANAHPEVFAHKTVGQVADHFAEVIGGLKKKPAVIGHSFGGLLTQIMAGRGLAAPSVAIDPALSGASCPCRSRR